MSQSATPPDRFAVPVSLPLHVWFDGGRLTSDGGLAWLSDADTALGLCAALAQVIPDWRHGPVRHSLETQYAAGSWECERRVVYKAEALPKGPNTRFVVTTQADPPLERYNWYVRHGEPEQWIDELKNACFADRLSCHAFWANQFRLLLHAAAYTLLDTLRRWLMTRGVPRMRLDTLRLRLIKIGGWVQQRLTVVQLHLASSHPGQPLWDMLAARSGS